MLRDFARQNRPMLMTLHRIASAYQTRPSELVEIQTPLLALQFDAYVIGLSDEVDAEMKKIQDKHNDKAIKNSKERSDLRSRRADMRRDMKARYKQLMKPKQPSQQHGHSQAVKDFLAQYTVKVKNG